MLPRMTEMLLRATRYAQEFHFSMAADGMSYTCETFEPRAEGIRLARSATGPEPDSALAAIMFHMDPALLSDLPDWEAGVNRGVSERLYKANGPGSKMILSYDASRAGQETQWECLFQGVSGFGILPSDALQALGQREKQGAGVAL